MMKTTTAKEWTFCALIFCALFAGLSAVSCSNQPAIAQTTRPTTAPTSQPATRPTTAPATRPAVSVLDRAPNLVPPLPTAAPVTSYVPPGDLSAAVNRASNQILICCPDEDYSWSGGPIVASNVRIIGNRSRLHLAKHPGDGCDINVRAAHVTFQNFSIIGDGGLAVRVDAPAASFIDCTTAKMNSFVFIDPPGVGFTALRCAQLDRCGGQWIYDFSDSCSVLDCEISYGSGFEEPVRFSGPDDAMRRQWPGTLPPVNCLVSGGMIYQPSGPANLQKSALAVRDGKVTVDSVHITGALTGGQIAGTDTAAVSVHNCTFDADRIYPNVSMQKGVRLAVDHCRFRGGDQPISVDYNSTVTATFNTIDLPSGKKLISHADGTTEDGVNTSRVAPAPATQPTH